ncbi:unnamed protein product [Leptidea sinapis]|uniref:Regulatory protein zeste n=1 Tax=Leptidea sinapis TaxID=189913 RepID=A0A5E4QQL5_9NEOP|nr:unnamed protein product [Leptidea sinapis]
MCTEYLPYIETESSVGGKYRVQSKKRQRSENWLEEDKNLLKELVRERVSAIENKNTDTNSNTIKVAAWNNLRDSFNCVCKGAQRTVAQLKAQWGLIKINAKRKKAEESNGTHETGGGPPPIICWLPGEIPSDSNDYDSDRINQIKVEELSEPPLPVVSEHQQAKKTNKYKRKVCRKTPAEQIAAVEIECRRQLHSIQMENERQRSKNLKLKEILIKKRIKFLYRNN